MHNGTVSLFDWFGGRGRRLRKISAQFHILIKYIGVAKNVNANGEEGDWQSSSRWLEESRTLIRCAPSCRPEGKAVEMASLRGVVAVMASRSVCAPLVRQVKEHYRPSPTGGPVDLPQFPKIQPHNRAAITRIDDDVARSIIRVNVHGQATARTVDAAL